MNESKAITSVCPKNLNAFIGKQKEYWIEVQLVDELGKPISNMPYKVENEATRCNHARFEGSSDSNGVIRIDRINWLDLTLKIDAQKLLMKWSSVLGLSLVIHVLFKWKKRKMFPLGAQIFRLALSRKGMSTITSE